MKEKEKSLSKYSIIPKPVKITPEDGVGYSGMATKCVAYRPSAQALIAAVSAKRSCDLSHGQRMVHRRRQTRVQSSIDHRTRGA